PAAPERHVHDPQGHQAHLRLPERGARGVAAARQGGRGRVREGRERGVREADARRDAGDEQGGRDRQADAEGGRGQVPEGERARVTRVVVLGGGSTGEHFV